MPRLAEIPTVPALRLLLCYALVVGLMFMYGRTHFYRDPGSVFFDENRAYEMHYTQHRLEEVDAFLREQTVVSSHSTSLEEPSGPLLDPYLKDSTTERASAGPEVCVSFLTVQRKSEQYVEEAIASALVGLAPEERRAMHIGVFFAQSNVGQHPSYRKPWIHSSVDSVYSYNLSAQQLDYVADLEDRAQLKEKSIFDYTYALDWCHATGAPYTLLLEGDILLADSWFVQILSALKDARDKLHLDTADWLYLRLFNQERSTGWSSRRVGDNHELVISIGVAMVLLSFKLIARRVFPSHRLADYATLLVISCIIVPTAVVFFYQAGKASLLPPRPGLKRENFGCCSQALLYPREQIPRLVAALRDQEPGAYDLMINRHANDEGLSRLTLYPILVQHMGVHSAMNNEDDARKVWSAAFESNEVDYLHRKHTELLHEMFSVAQQYPE